MKLGKYHITEKLGEGSMGAVYKAYDEVLDRHVAIKTMAADIQWNKELKERFYREARSAASLHHPNIVTIHDLGEDGKIPFIVMELLTGKELKNLIRDKMPLTIEQKLSIMAQVSDGLGHAHNHQIIHRDIKPGNIHVSDTMNVKILDFGIAHIPSSELTRVGARLGTPFYMSPEQIRGEDCDERSDIFSAGIVFYELLTYVHPFLAKDMVRTMENIVFKDPLPFEEQLPDAPPGLWPILSSCLAKEPQKRCRRMSDVAQNCRQLIEELSAGSRKMKGELDALLAGLQSAIEHGQASASQKQVFQEAKAFLAPGGIPDNIALQKLLSRVSKEFQPRIETASSKAPAPVPDAAADKTQILPSFSEMAKEWETSPPAKPSVKSPGPPEPAPIAPSPVTPPVKIPPKPADGKSHTQGPGEIGAAPSKEVRSEPPSTPLPAQVGEATQVHQAMDTSPKLPAPDSKDQTEKAEKERKRKERLQDLCRESAELLGKKKYDAAAIKAKEALDLDPNSAQALELRRKIEFEKEENRKRQEAFSLAAKARELQAKKDFGTALSLLESALKLLPQDPQLIALMDQAKRAQLDVQKQREAPVIVEPDKKPPVPTDLTQPMMPAGDVQRLKQESIKPKQIPNLAEKEQRKFEEPMPKAGDETVILGTSPKPKSKKLLIGVVAAAVLLIAAGAAIHLARSRKLKTFDLTPQISLAKSSLDQRLYDKAINLSEQILAASPGNPEASAILKQAREKKTQLNIDALMLEAQNFRVQNQPEEAIRVLKKIQEIEPGHNPALTVLSQIEAEISATKSAEEQDKAVKEWIEKATRLLAAGKINEANSEIDKVARLRPNADELLPLRKKLKEAAAREKNGKDEAQRQLRVAEFQRKVADLFSQGKYDEALPVLNDWLREEPQNAQASSLRNQIGRAQTAIKEGEAAITQRKFDDALNAVALLQSINPSDPNIVALKKQIDEGKASSHAAFSIFRLSESGTLFFDDQQIGVGEIENKVVPIGRHRISVKNAQGKQSRLTLDLTDGQKAELVYDASVPEIRAFASTDRAQIEKRKTLEESHTYQVEHNHGILRGKCKGLLTISGLGVSFKTSESDHSFNYRFHQLILARSKEHLELSTPDNKKFTFTLSDANKAEEAMKIWDKLLHLAKD
jgi:serine/threonine protein kinase/tetratricopeptide (TPR) repeat protein